MADVGDEVGEGFKRGINRIVSEVFREWLRQHMGKRPAPGQEHCSAPLDDPELTRVVTEALDAAEIPYEVKRQSLTVGSDGQLHERATLLFDANDFDRVREVMDAKLEEVKAAERAEGRDLGKATISLQNDEQTQAVTAALEAEGIPYKVERTTLASPSCEAATSASRSSCRAWRSLRPATIRTPRPSSTAAIRRFFSGANPTRPTGRSLR